MSDADCDEISLDSNSNDCDLSSAAYVIHDFEKRLIEEVKLRPFLYDHTNGDFKDLKRKDIAWAEVAEATGKTVDKCQCRWKSLRDRYVRESRKIREGCGPKRHLWEMFKYLTFLDDFPRLHRGRYSDYNFSQKAGKTSNKRPAVFILPTSTSPQTPPQVTLSQVTSSPPPPHQVVTPAAVSTTPAVTLSLQFPEKSSAATQPQPIVKKVNGGSSNNNNNILTTLVDMADGCSAFGMSVSATLRTLALEQQEMAKLRIQQVLYEVQFS